MAASGMPTEACRMRCEEVTVIDDRKLLVHDGVIDALLTADPADVACLGWQEPDRLRAVLERIAQSSTAHTDSVLAGPAHRVVPSGRYALLDALARLGFEESLRLFEQADLLDLFGRWRLMHYLFTDPSFLTLDELADVLEEFARHLEANRASLVTRGVPRTTLGASYPGMLLSYLYPTKSIYREDSPPMANGVKRPSPRDRALEHLPAAKWTTRIHTYWWVREGPSTSSEDLVLDEPYEDAARTVHLDEQDAARVEAGRASFLDLEITVLNALAKGLRRGDATKLWEESLTLITEALPADDAAFYLRMDQWGYGYDIASGKGEGKGYLSVRPGGLTNLLSVIGHCEKELTIGTMDHAKGQLLQAIPDDVPVSSYFQAVGQPWQQEQDRALDQLVEFMVQEDSFWTEFQKRVNSAIENEFYAVVVIRTKVKQKLVHLFEPQLRTFAEWNRAHLELTGSLPVLQLSAPCSSEPDSTNLFRKDDGIWTIQYAGTTVHLPHVMGLEYLAYLLRQPGRATCVEELDAVIRGNLGPAADISAGLSLSGIDGFRVGGIGDAGTLTDPETIKAARARQHTLNKDLETTLASGNLDAANRIRSDLAMIKRYLSETVDRRGNPRKANDHREKARINVQRHIKRAIGQIAQKHPTLGAHLKSSVQTGDYCIYDPPLADRVPWTF